MQEAVIICVDDDKLVLKILEAQLNAEFGQDYTIKPAFSGAEALEIISNCQQQKQAIPVVISDLEMPGMKGDALLKEIHQISRDTYTILLTGKAGIQDIANAVNFGNLFRYLTKPWDSTDLCLTVKEALKSYLQSKKLEDQHRLLKIYNEQLEEKVNERTKALELEIKERKGMEQALIQANNKLTIANKDLMDFVHIVSHDLQAPLRGISNISDWIYEDYVDRLDEDGKSQLDQLRERVRTMDSLIAGVLKYAKLGHGFTKKGRLDLHKLVLGILELIGPPKNVTITIAKKLPSISGDQLQFQQIFQNLIANAIQAIGDEPGEVKIDWSLENKYFRFSISDSGPGIKLEDQQRIFKIFQKVHQETKTENTGIGLAIVKKLVEMNAGEVWVESNYGAGSTFWFTLAR